MKKITKKDLLHMMAKENIIDREHTELSASWSKIWLHCTKAVELSKYFPEADENEDYTVEGTQAHFLGELLLKGHITKEELPSEFSDLEFYYDKVKEIQADGNLWVEVSIEMTEALKSHTPIWGRSDAVVLAKDDGVDVIDLKWGKGVKVDAFENEQEMLYAVGTLEFLNQMGLIDLKTMDPNTRVTLHIIQPRLDVNYSYYNITVGKLKEFVTFVRKQLKKIEANELVFDKEPSRCQFCKGKSFCPIYVETVDTALVEVNKDLAVIDPKRLIDLYEKKADVMAFYKALEKYVKANIQLSPNGEYMGYKIIIKEGNREVVDEEALINQFVAAGCKEEELRDASIVGMTKLDRLAKKYGIAKDDIAGIGKKRQERVVPVKDKRDELFKVEG